MLDQSLRRDGDIGFNGLSLEIESGGNKLLRSKAWLETRGPDDRD